MEFYSPENHQVVESVVMLPQEGAETGPNRRPRNAFAVLRDGYSVLWDAAFSWNVDGIRQLAEDGYPPVALVLSHRDVVTASDALDAIHDEFDIPILLHRFDLETPEVAACDFDFEFEETDAHPVLAQSRLRVVHIPGHSPGSIMLHSAEDAGGTLLAGDSAVGPGPKANGAQPRLERPKTNPAADESLRRRWATLVEELPIRAVLPLHGAGYTVDDLGLEEFDSAVRNIWEGEPLQPDASA